MYDAIVVGTGPSGAAVAKALVEKKLKVLIVEWGKQGNPGTLSNLINISGYPGKGFFLSKDWMVILRAITVGGSAAINFATAAPPPEDIFSRYSIDLTGEYDFLKKTLPIAPLRDHLVGPMANKIELAAKELSLPWQRLNKIIFQNNCKTECHRCLYGCSFEAKWHPGLFIDDACMNGADLLCHAKVTKVIIRDGKAVGIEYYKNGKVDKVYAKNVVISAGAIGSCEILRESGFGEVGDKLFVDPVVAAIGLLSKPIGSGKEIPMVSGITDKIAGFSLADMALPKPLHYVFSGMVGRVSTHRKALTIMVKGRDGMDGYISKNGRPVKKLLDSDNVSLELGKQLSKDILESAGSEYVYFTRPFAAHPGGTISIDRHVDRNLSCKYKNLYVCDSSVIPEPWGIPPSLSLMCLGLRLATYIEKNS